MLGLSYSSIDIPRDNRFASGPSVDPPELVENARLRSTPGIATDVSRPCPLQNNNTDWATFDGYSRAKEKSLSEKLFYGYGKLERTASVRTSPARSIFNMVIFSFSTSRCSFSTIDAYGLNMPVISSVSILHSFSERSLRLWGTLGTISGR